MLLFQCSTICDDKETDAVPFLSAKVVRGMWLSKGLCRLVCLENLHTYGLYFPPKPCASPPRSGGLVRQTAGEAGRVGEQPGVVQVPNPLLGHGHCPVVQHVGAGAQVVVGEQAAGLVGAHG